MTTTPTDPQTPPAVQPPEGTEPPAAGPPPTDPGGEPTGSGNAEAAKWRTKLRETESQRDALATRLAGLQRREVERLAADRLAQPGDLFDVHGIELEEVLDEAGDIDATLVGMAVDALLATRPGLHRDARTPDVTDFGGGRRGTGTDPRGGERTTWGQLFSARRSGETYL